jgi:arsenite oxidase small subunit
MDRRKFVKLCTSTAALVATNPRLLAQTQTTATHYKRTQLVDSSRRPVLVSQLRQGETYLFHYPFVGTPCFLVRLPKPARDTAVTYPDGTEIVWPGGVGPDASVVAFVAICPHQLSYPSKGKSFINYRADTSEVAGRSNVIVCCAHHSVFDPTAGGNVVAGPAPHALATILLEHDPASDGLYATGVLGANVFRDFFKAYRRELIEEFGRGQAKQEVSDSTVVKTVADYTAQQFTC